ncbi:hypothetical protein B0T21DRAFT_205516 [Apiosordaria backusii]|uniref:Uncharacterized protein n=1 Tax=Apiosordaria backusii TaxID=314023 RepID=A0AA40B7F5_9PEZI|nr:hypothetical protein B0T21DRAFT_205516 [Apiosordaria backusii]
MCLIGFLIPTLTPRKRSRKHKRKSKRRQYRTYDEFQEKPWPPYEDTNESRDLALVAEHTEPRIYATLEEDLLAHEQIRQKERVRLLGRIEDEMDRLQREYDRRQLFEASLPLARSPLSEEQKVLVEQGTRVTDSNVIYYQDTAVCYCHVCHNIRQYDRP